jgi:Domain of unknown function (DUF4189)
LIVSTATAQRRALFFLALTLVVGASRFITESWAAGAFAVGKCGAYGQAFDYAAEAGALAAAKKQCKGECTTVTMKRACAAFAVDMANPCGAHGYAVKPRISASLNEATRKCYEFGGKECVIRAWACDAKG